MFCRSDRDKRLASDFCWRLGSCLPDLFLISFPLDRLSIFGLQRLTA